MDEGKGQFYNLDPIDLGIDRIALENIKGADRETNARIVYGVLEGKTGPYRQTVLLNAAAALLAAGRAADYKEGIQAAAEAIDSGKSIQTLRAMIGFSRDRVAAC